MWLNYTYSFKGPQGSFKGTLGNKIKLLQTSACSPAIISQKKGKLSH